MATKTPNNIKHSSPAASEEEEDYAESSADGICSFHPFRRNPRNIQRKPLLPESYKKTRWAGGMKAGREFLEILAPSNPKWKNKSKMPSFQYDPISYALNFDGGNSREEEGGGYLSFSARFAAPMSRNGPMPRLEGESSMAFHCCIGDSLAISA